MHGSLVKPSYVPQAPFFGKNCGPGILKTCNSPVEVFLRATGALFFGKNDVPGIFSTCDGPVEVFLRAAGVFFLQQVTHKWLWLYL